MRNVPQPAASRPAAAVASAGSVRKSVVVAHVFDETALPIAGSSGQPTPVRGAATALTITGRAFAVLGVAFDGDPDDISTLAVHDQIARGLPARALLGIDAKLAVLDAMDTIGPAIGISERTFHRWKKQPPGTPLGPEVSGRLWKFAEILARATDVLGSQTAAENWLQTPAMALDRRRPIDLLSTPVGVVAVEELLTRIEYGVYT